VNTLRCPRCQIGLPVALTGPPELVPCPGCREPLHVDVFPALFRPPPPVSVGEKVLIEGEASCFYHPQKKAVVPCASCGRFLCALCDVELNDQHLCPSCLETGKKKGKIVNLQNQRIRYDRLAFSLGIVPFLIPPLWFILPVTGIGAIYVVARYWKSPLSLVTGHKGWFIAGLVLGFVQIGVGIFLYYHLINS
jgi:hypothetical protein